MTELNVSSGKQGGRGTLKRMPMRVDLTAMVDLAFLLITFFMLTTSLAKHQEMPVVMPAAGPPGGVSDKRTMTICLGKDNQAMWYLGLADKPIIIPTIVGYGRDLRAAILETAAKVNRLTGKGLIVLIKPGKNSMYGNLVNTMDELNITAVPTYAIAGLSAKDVDLMKQNGIY